MEIQTILSVLEKGEVRLKGRFLESSNTTFFVTCLLEEEVLQAVYKPESGQSKLYDFEPATLPRREVAAWLVCRAAGWDFVPPTIYRKIGLPFGAGSVIASPCCVAIYLSNSSDAKHNCRLPCPSQNYGSASLPESGLVVTI